MSSPDNGAPAPLENIQRDWNDFTLRVAQAETERTALELENKNLRTLLERTIEHRQKSHTELVNILAGLVSKLPLNDIGVIVSKLVEHNSHAAEVSASLIKGRIEDGALQPAILKQLDKTKRDLAALVKPAVDELLQLDSPLDPAVLQSFVANPENFFTPSAVRASRGFVKGQLPRERVVKEFGAEALPLFRDVTTDLKFNPRPKPEEIMLAFVDDFEAQLAQNPALAARRGELLALFQKVRATREHTERSRAMKNVFLRLSFVLELSAGRGRTPSSVLDKSFTPAKSAPAQQAPPAGSASPIPLKALPAPDAKQPGAQAPTPAEARTVTPPGTKRP